MKLKKIKENLVILYAIISIEYTTISLADLIATKLFGI